MILVLLLIYLPIRFFKMEERGWRLERREMRDGVEVSLKRVLHKKRNTSIE